MREKIEKQLREVEARLALHSEAYSSGKVDTAKAFKRVEANVRRKLQLQAQLAEVA